MKSFKFFPSAFFLITSLSFIIPVINAQTLEKQPLIDSLKQVLPNAKDDTSKVKTLYRLSAAFAQSDSTISLDYAKKCMNISRQIKWTKGIGLAYIAYASEYSEISNYTASLQNSQSAYDIFKSINDENHMGSSCVMIAKNYRELGYYTKAVESDLAALKLFEDTNDRYHITACYTNLGSSYYYMLDYDKAIENYRKALAGSKQLNDKYGIAATLDNMANVFVETGAYDSADVYNLQAIKIFEEIDDQPELSRAYVNRGNVLTKLYNAKAAYEYYIKATEIDRRLGIKGELLYDYGGIGILYLTVAKDTTGRYIVPSSFEINKKALLRKAQYYFKQVFSQKNTSDINLLMFYSNFASETEERLGNYKAALAFQKEHILYKDSIFNDENKKKIAALETQRLTEVKDKEIQLLSKDKALQASEIKRQTLIKNIIIAAVALAAIITFFFLRSYNRRRKTTFDKQVMETEMKALRAQMNPHFIFNSLHSINKYIIENDKDNASGYLSKFAKLMRLVLENSREQEVSLESDLAALELYMQLESLRFQNRFEYIIEVAPEIDKENTLISPLLLQPFAENSILHGVSNKEGGIIKINISTAENNMMRCIVEDNGAGRALQPETEQQQKNTKKRRSLGMKIMEDRLYIINQLKKAKAAVNIFDLKNAENKSGGLRVELLLPLQMAF